MITRINLTVANMYLVRSRRAVVVDTGLPGSTPRILKALEQHGIARSDVSLILLTHAHSDHAGSALALREALGVPVAVHRDDAAMLREGRNRAGVIVGIEAAMSKTFVRHDFPGMEADVLLDTTSDLAEFGLDARMLHTPGHSTGSISLLFDGGEAIVGDILRGGVMGGMLLSGQPHLPYFMESMDHLPTLLESVQRVLDAGARLLYTGHGGPIPRAAAERWLARQRTARG